MPTGSQRIPAAGKIKHVTYETAYQIVKSFERQLAAEKFDLVLGIARSGIVPATMISQAIEVPVAFVLCSRTDKTPKMLTPATLKNKKVLVVEDIIGLGLTIGKVAAFAKKYGAKVTSFCLFYDKATTTFKPDYGVATQHFIHAQWDRKNLTPISRKALKEKNGRCSDADTAEFIGIDASIKSKKSVEQIMAFCGISKKQYPTHTTTLDGITTMQEKYIIACGASKYFTNNLERAVQIANKTPCTDVYYWGIKDKIRIFANSVNL